MKCGGISSPVKEEDIITKQENERLSKQKIKTTEEQSEI